MRGRLFGRLLGGLEGLLWRLSASLGPCSGKCLLPQFAAHALYRTCILSLLHGVHAHIDIKPHLCCSQKARCSPGLSLCGCDTSQPDQVPADLGFVADLLRMRQAFAIPFGSLLYVALTRRDVSQIVQRKVDGNFVTQFACKREAFLSTCNRPWQVVLKRGEVTQVL